MEPNTAEQGILAVRAALDLLEKEVDLQSVTSLSSKAWLVSTTRSLDAIDRRLQRQASSSDGSSGPLISHERDRCVSIRKIVEAGAHIMSVAQMNDVRVHPNNERL